MSAEGTKSGKFVLRLPVTLHKALAVAAEREGVSLNLYCTALLASALADQRRKELR